MTPEERKFWITVDHVSTIGIWIGGIFIVLKIIGNYIPV